ncbi:MAG TPA: hypothetical protein VF576_02495, partial [Rubricoccaceae bacterium]
MARRPAPPELADWQPLPQLVGAVAAVLPWTCPYRRTTVTVASPAGTRTRTTYTPGASAPPSTPSGVSAPSVGPSWRTA